MFQEFALKFVRGDFENAHPDKGRFRHFVKTVIYRLVIDYQRRQKRNRQNQDLAEVAPDEILSPTEQMETDFIQSWRSELLAHAWAALQAEEERTGKPYHTVLRLRADNPELRSPDIAAALTSRLGREIRPGNARVLVHRSRELFAQQLLDLVEDSLRDDSDDELENELITLDLLAYCRPVLETRKKK